MHHQSSAASDKAHDPATFVASILQTGICKSVESIIDEINILPGIEKHMELRLQSAGYVTMNRLCTYEICSGFDHMLHRPKGIRDILGFAFVQRSKQVIENTTDKPILGQRPANLLNGLPSMLMLYSDICEPYVTEDVQSRLLRAVSLDMEDYSYGGMKIRSPTLPIYFPLLYSFFESIEIDIRDQHGNPKLLDYGTLTVTLHFKRTE